MSSIYVVILHLIVVQTQARDSLDEVKNSNDKIIDKFISRLVDRQLKAPKRFAVLDNTTLGKSGHLKLSQPASPFSSLSSPWTSQQGMKAARRATAPISTERLPLCNWPRTKELSILSKLGFHSTSSGAVQLPRAMAGDPSTAMELSENEYYKELKGVERELLQAAPSDFFELMGVSENATKAEIKAAYRQLQKIGHPDIVGEAAMPFSAILNLARNTLMDDDAREAYADQARAYKSQSGGAFDGHPVSNWAGPASEQRAVFVDETACVGCKACTLWAPGTFGMETTYGRARCTTQWGDEEDLIQTAVEVCPVLCIYWVQRSQLPILEYSMKGCIRESVHVMQQGTAKDGSNESPFTRAEVLLKYRRVANLANGAHDNVGEVVSEHTKELAGKIAAAWIKLPEDVKRSGWPSWTEGGGAQSRKFSYSSAGTPNQKLTGSWASQHHAESSTLRDEQYAHEAGWYSLG